MRPDSSRLQSPEILHDGRALPFLHHSPPHFPNPRSPTPSFAAPCRPSPQTNCFLISVNISVNVVAAILDFLSPSSRRKAGIQLCPPAAIPGRPKAFWLAGLIATTRVCVFPSRCRDISTTTPDCTQRLMRPHFAIASVARQSPRHSNGGSPTCVQPHRDSRSS